MRKKICPGAGEVSRNSPRPEVGVICGALESQGLTSAGARYQR